MGRVHDLAVVRAKVEAQKAGLGPCASNQKLGSRRPDLKCGSAYIEVKTFGDLRTDHTKQQLADIRKEADKSGLAAITYIAEGECHSGINDLGQSLIKERGLKMCPCPVPKSDVAELTDCLSRALLNEEGHEERRYTVSKKR